MVDCRSARQTPAILFRLGIPVFRNGTHQECSIKIAGIFETDVNAAIARCLLVGETMRQPRNAPCFNRAGMAR
jgi:hypothetical protein